MQQGEDEEQSNMAREAREDAEMEFCGEAEPQTDSLSPSALKLYEAQFFGFTPQSCMLRVKSAFQDCLCDILSVVEKVCVRELSKGKSESNGDEEQLRVRARECTRKLQQFLLERFKQLSDRMETLLVARCLSVPPNVLLPEDQIHKKYPQDVQEVLRLESSLADLQRAYEVEICARQAMLMELEEQREVQKQLDEFLRWVQELQSAWVTEGVSGFHESLKIVTESVKKLQDAIYEMCNKAPQ